MQISGLSLRQKDCLYVNSPGIRKQLFFHINLLILPFSQCIYYLIKTIGGFMSRYHRIIVFTCLLGALLYGCSGSRNHVDLTICGGNPIIYESDRGERIIARYFTLSDRSLDFVKVTLPGGREYTLPQVLSASGVRYTDDRELVWWTKGSTAFAEVRDENGQWERKYTCNEIRSNK